MLASGEDEACVLIMVAMGRSDVDDVYVWIGDEFGVGAIGFRG